MDHAPTLALLVVIILLLWRQQSQRDFYVVRHLGYDLAFKEHPGVTYVTADQEWHGHAVSHVTVRAALARSHAMIAQLHQDTRG